MEVKLPSGLIWIDVPPERLKDAGPAVFCTDCGRVTADPGPFFCHRTLDDMRVSHPTCGHGLYLVCVGCADRGCPACGCQEIYT